MTTLKELTEQIVQFRDDRNWKQFHTPKDMIISLVLETAELAEHFQWKTEEEFERMISEGEEHFAEELADVLYWVLLIARDFDVDLAATFQKKMMKNAEKYPIKTAMNSKEKAENSSFA